MSNESTEYGQNMLIVSSYYGENNSFKMIPVTEDCPYVECIYDPKINFLVVIGKQEKSILKMVEKLDDNGYPEKIKNFIPEVHQSGPGKIERKHITVFQEFYIIKKDEQIAFIKQFAVNAKDYPFEEYMIQEELPDEAPAVVDAQLNLIDEHGNMIPKTASKKAAQKKKK